jgi:hypothetical protein
MGAWKRGSGEAWELISMELWNIGTLEQLVITIFAAN